MTKESPDTAGNDASQAASDDTTSTDAAETEAPESEATAENGTTEAGTTEAGTDAAHETLTRKLRRSRTLNVVLGAAAAFLLVIAIAQPLSQQNPAINPDAVQATDGAASATPAPEEAPARPDLVLQLAKSDPNDPMAFGDIDAPLTVIEWTDYRCPFCAKFTNDTLPVLMEQYIDKGLVRYEVRDVSFFGDDSTAAAVAARAAGNQGKFAEYFDTLYAAAPQSGHPDMPREKLIAFAEEAGVPDIAQFTADLDDPALAEAVATSTTDAQQLGVTAVPFFIVGGTYFSGAQPIETFQKVFTEQLELAKAK